MNRPDWVDASLTRRAPHGGAVGIDGKARHGGAFEPFYIPRPLMPQIEEADLTAFVQWAAWEGVAVLEVEREADALRFHQRVNMARVRTMPPDLMAKPLLISRDGYVLDGNHRAAAHKLAGSPAPCLEVQADFQDAMRLLFSFAGTTDGQAL